MIKTLPKIYNKQNYLKNDISTNAVQVLGYKSKKQNETKQSKAKQSKTVIWALPIKKKY